MVSDLLEPVLLKVREASIKEAKIYAENAAINTISTQLAAQQAHQGVYYAVCLITIHNNYVEFMHIVCLGGPCTVLRKLVFNKTYLEKLVILSKQVYTCIFSHVIMPRGVAVQGIRYNS